MSMRLDSYLIFTHAVVGSAITNHKTRKRSFAHWCMPRGSSDAHHHCKERKPTQRPQLPSAHVAMGKRRNAEVYTSCCTNVYNSGSATSSDSLHRSCFSVLSAVGNRTKCYYVSSHQFATLASYVLPTQGLVQFLGQEIFLPWPTEIYLSCKTTLVASESREEISFPHYLLLCPPRQKSQSLDSKLLCSAARRWTPPGEELY